MYPRTDSRDAIVALFERVAPAVHREEGCLLYALHEGPSELVIIEKWSSPESHRAHVEGAALDSFRQGVAELLDKPSTVVRLSPLPLGDEAGTL